MASGPNASSRKKPVGHGNPATTLYRHLRSLAVALHAEADKVERHQSDGRLEIVSLAGWTIYAAYRAGFLDSLPALKKIAEGELGEGLKKGTAKRLPDTYNLAPVSEPKRHQLAPDATIEDYLRYLDQREAEEVLAAIERTTAMLEGRPIPPPKLPLDSDWAAEMLVDQVWKLLAPQQVDKLPPDVARAYMSEQASSHPLEEPLVSAFVKAAWVADEVADILLRKGLPEAAGWLKVTQAAELTGRNKGEITRWCNKNVIAHNGKKGTARRVVMTSLLDHLKSMPEDRGDAPAAHNRATPPQKATQHVKLRTSAAATRETSSGLQWQCKGCGAEFADQPTRCDKCGKSDFEPMWPRRK